jgi:uncharacterized phosphatase
MNTICLVRHGETDANKNYIVQGRIDNPLNENGRNQAKATGKYLARNHELFDVYITSPLKRAFETARIIASELDQSKPIFANCDLVERNFGSYDGQKIDENYSKLILSGEIPDMEKNHELENRVMNALHEICEKNPNKNILIVAHSHVIKALLVQLLSGFSYISYLANCSLNYLSYENGKFIVLKHNVNPLDV